MSWFEPSLFFELFNYEGPSPKRVSLEKPKYRWWGQGYYVEANTRSEARALLKKKLGRLPDGTRVIKVEEC